MLTAQVKAGGCASKLSPSILDRVLRTVPRVEDENVLVGYETSDDAGVYRLSNELAMVQTVDFFTPVVDDPFTFGAIAAANALSDVYAMGGRPVSALSILAWPPKNDVEHLEAILKGGASKIHEAGAVILGGHSVSDEEIKFGYAVTGVVHPARVHTNAGAQTGDALVFTKRIGTGVISTALKRGMAQERDIETAIESMLTLNRAACEAMLLVEAHACTDVTGFGLIGHAREMAVASRVTLEIEANAIQFLPGAVEYSRAECLSGGLKNNRAFAESCAEVKRELAPGIENLLYDPQTSGGLLISVREQDADALIARYPAAYRIGRVTEKTGRVIHIV